MSVKEIAIKDIREELSKEGKSFLAFHKELNPIMRKLVKQQLFEQGYRPKTRKTQLMAHCFFCHSTEEIKYNDYSKYYEQV